MITASVMKGLKCELVLKLVPTYAKFLTLYFAMSKNGQTHFKNLAANGARFLKYV